MTPPAIDAQYDDPRLVALYDLLNAADHDYRFYLDLIGPAPRSVLDLGCGTGTFACLLAARGHAVYAVDPAPAMLAHARSRPGGAAVDWHLGTLDVLPMQAQFDLVCLTGHAFQCLGDDAALLPTLAGLHARLRPGGRLLFETRNPQLAPWTHWTPRASRRRLARPGASLTLWHRVHAVAGEFVEFDTCYRLQPENLLLRSHSRLRFLSAAALCQRLAGAGFAAPTLFGDWDGSPFDPARSPEIIVAAPA